MRIDPGDLQIRLVFAEGVEIGNALIDEREVGGGKRAVFAFKCENRAARKNIMRESLLQELVTPDAGAAVGEEADIVVDRLCVPVRREQG